MSFLAARASGGTVFTAVLSVDGTPQLALAAAGGSTLTARLDGGAPQLSAAVAGGSRFTARISGTVGLSVRISGAARLASRSPDLPSAPLVDLSDSQPMGVGVDLSGTLVQEFVSAAATPFPGLRAIPAVAIGMPTPAVVEGRPTTPLQWARLAVSVRVSGAYAGPVPKKPAPPTRPGAVRFAARWTVEDLPDPAAYPNGYYWLGDPSGADGTASIQATARQWAPDASTLHAPAWRSRFPFKPSVTAFDHYPQGGGVVHHPKGINFNSHFIEHLWLDWGANRPQPVTWVIAAMVVSWPAVGYAHYLLDAGKPPPAYTVDDCYRPRPIGESLGYRTLLKVGAARTQMAANDSPSHTVQVTAAAAPAPRMIAGVFNGDHSELGWWGPGGKHVSAGPVASGGAHRYTVMGRRQGILDQGQASHVMVFEARYWNAALDAEQLADEYGDLASRWKFGQYR